MQITLDLIAKANLAKQNGQIEEALNILNEAFNTLIDQAAIYAREMEESENTDLKSLTPVLLAHSKDYLKRDLLASEILNSMGIVFNWGTMKMQSKNLKRLRYISQMTHHLTIPE